MELRIADLKPVSDGPRRSQMTPFEAPEIAVDAIAGC
jgi:hypothetical protein